MEGSKTKVTYVVEVRELDYGFVVGFGVADEDEAVQQEYAVRDADEVLERIRRYFIAISADW